MTERSKPAEVQPDELLPGLPPPRILMPPIALPDAPEIVPARMINEAMFCERLLYLEWAQGEFSHNAFTKEGAILHERVDGPSAPMPPPEREGAAKAGRVLGEDGPTRATEEDDEGDDDEPPPWTARSVWLTSERLGITAKIDLVEAEGGEVVPVEYKRGKPWQGRARQEDEAQLCAQALLLREHGYVVTHGEVFYAAVRKRLRVEFTHALVRATLGAAERARKIVGRGVIPAPLVDSPRCTGCSLAGICLPDEVSLLRGLAGEPLDEPEKPAQLALGFTTDPDDLPDWLRAEPDADDELGDTSLGPIDEEVSLDEAPEGDEAGSEPLGPSSARPSRSSPRGAPPEGGPLRRVHPARDERTALYVTAQGARLTVDGSLIAVEHRGAPPTIARLPSTSHVCVYGNVQITTQAIAALLERGIPVLFFSSGGFLRGRLVAHDTKNVELRVMQYRTADDREASLRIARTLVAAKIRNQRTLLRRNAVGLEPEPLRELEVLARKAEREASVEALLGLEGTAARIYFAHFRAMLKGEAASGDFDLESRNRRPPKDPINALLSFAYSLLTKDHVVAAFATGLDPLLGFLHKPRYGRPALVLDLMEPMRPLVADSTVVGALNTGVVGKDDFVRSPAGCALTSAGRKRFIAAYERRVDQLVTHPLFGYRISYRRIFEVQARLLGRHLLGELDTYPAFRTR